MRLIDADFVVKGLVEIRDNLPEGFPKRFQQETIRKALRCIEEAPTIEAEPVRHGRWEVWYEHEDGWDHHRCTNCEEPALFQYEYIDDWDEDSDGEWFYLGQRENGVQEFLTNHCLNCGARMDGESK